MPDPANMDLDQLLALADQAVRTGAVDNAMIYNLSYLAHLARSLDAKLTEVIEWQNKQQEETEQPESSPSESGSSPSPKRTPGSRSSSTGKTGKAKPASGGQGRARS